MRIAIINGPNLNLLGKREREIYGDECMEDYLPVLRSRYSAHEISYSQANEEGVVINLLHEYALKVDGIVLNPGGFTHQSVSVADAVRAIKVPVVEVHVSQLPGREHYRGRSLVAPACKGSISGFGLTVYELGVHALILDQ
ncbi:MAG: type II 3-dehydroquinate dehydratase [Bacteroidales bacterium]